MKGLVYGGPGTRSWTETPDPRIQDPKDAIIRIDAVTIPAHSGALKVVLSR
jgi:alcohol dehydrogenase